MNAMQVQVLSNPSTDEFRRVVESTEPNFVYLQGEQQPGAFTEEIGSLVWGDVDLSTPEALCRLFGSTLPTIVSVYFFIIHSMIVFVSSNLICYTF